MKIRIFKRLVDGVFDVRVQTEDWSENDKRLMVKFGEPEINLGGTFYCIPNGLDVSSSDSSSEDSGATATLDEIYARIYSESPFVQKFDMRDYGSLDHAKCLAAQWSSAIETRLTNAVTTLRSQDNFFATEEITEV